MSSRSATRPHSSAPAYDWPVVLKLVPKQPKPEPTRRRQVADVLLSKTPAYLLACQRCGGMELIETVVGVQVLKDGKHRGGAKTKICLSCMLQGQRVEVR